MLKKLLSKAAPTPANLPAIPGGQRVYAIGDIHGRADLFNQLLGKIEADNAARDSAEVTLILLGDLVDRGPDSARVLDMAIEMKQAGNVRMLAGNHEEVFLTALTDRSVESVRFFYRIGGQDTILSYGIDPGELSHWTMEELTERLPAIVPQEHVALMQEMEDRIVIGDYLFVHAGIKPGLALENQKLRHLRWIRDEFLDHEEPFDLMVVHGHTVTEGVEERSNRIGIDTGAYASNVLTAIGLEGTDRWFIDTAEPVAEAA